MKGMFFSLVSFFVFLNAANLIAQGNRNILTIGDHQFSEGEFWHVYNKNRHLPGFNETPDDFAVRFINYKLKVVEAMHQGLDTVPSFVKEFGKYSEDLKTSFLVDSVALEKVAREAHRNMQEVIEASHILIRLQPGSASSDTLTAWKKMDSVRKRVLSGEDFGELATTYSEDPSAAGNKGYLGYFSAFRMIYPFEKAAYATAEGEVSDIIRTDFGYHIVKVHSRQPNPGRIRVAHIMKMFPRSATASDEAKAYVTIDSIYHELLKGKDFASLARQHSDDGQSANQGGEMRAFSLQEMVPEFALAAFALNSDGEISAPVRTDFGWHIIKRLEHTPVGDFTAERVNIMNMMGRDGRDQTGHDAFVASKRSSARFYLNESLLDRVISEMSADNSNSKAFVERLNSNGDELLFKYHDYEFKLHQLLNSIENVVSFNSLEGAPAITRLLDGMVNEAIVKVEKRDLAKNIPEYRYLVNEYYDGLLIFELSNQEVWQKVGSDSTALVNLFNENPMLFAKPPVLTGFICEAKTKRLAKRTAKAIKRDGQANLVQILIHNARSEQCYTCKEGRYPFVLDATNPLDGTVLPEGNSFSASSHKLFWQGEITQNPAPLFEEVRGQVMSAYQNRLEAEWVESLRAKYQPVFNYKLIQKRRN